MTPNSTSTALSMKAKTCRRIDSSDRVTTFAPGCRDRDGRAVGQEPSAVHHDGVARLQPLRDLLQAVLAQPGLHHALARDPLLQCVNHLPRRSQHHALLGHHERPLASLDDDARVDRAAAAEQAAVAAKLHDGVERAVIRAYRRLDLVDSRLDHPLGRGRRRQHHPEPGPDAGAGRFGQQQVRAHAAACRPAEQRIARPSRSRPAATIWVSISPSIGANDARLRQAAPGRFGARLCRGKLLAQARCAARARRRRRSSR